MKHKKIVLFLILSKLYLVGCNGKIITQNQMTATFESAFQTALAENQPESTPTPTRLTPTQKPTMTITPELIVLPSPTQLPAVRIPMIEYHNPSYYQGDQVKMEPEWFEEQIRWLGENEFKTLTSEEFSAYIEGVMQPPQKSVVLRFDIGVPDYKEYSEIVIPLLREYGFHALIFILVPTFIDDCDRREEDFICWEDLRQWEAEGLITVGSHGMYHPDYAEADRSYIRWDAEESKRIIDEKLGRETIWFAYPYDSTPPQAEELLEPLGYQFAVSGWESGDRSVVWGEVDRWNLPAYYPYSSDDWYPYITSYQLPFDDTFGEMIEQAIEIYRIP